MGDGACGNVSPEAHRNSSIPHGWFFGMSIDARSGENRKRVHTIVNAAPSGPEGPVRPSAYPGHSENSSLMNSSAKIISRQERKAIKNFFFATLASWREISLALAILASDPWNRITEIAPIRSA